MRICEYFRSLQGEGILIGVPTYFIRTSGCNLSCVWCDTLYAKEDFGKDMSIEEIVDLIEDTNDVCLTGGEPLLQEDVQKLLKRLLDAGKRITVETNGSVDIKDIPKHDRIVISMDIKCPSSGMSEKMLLSNLAHLSKKDQVKFIIGDKNDFHFAVRFLREHKMDTNVVFTPVGGMDMRPIADEVVDKKLNVRVLPQLHKMIWGEHCRSV